MVEQSKLIEELKTRLGEMFLGDCYTVNVSYDNDYKYPYINVDVSKQVANVSCHSTTVSKFSLSFLQDCFHIVVSHGAYVSSNFDRKGLGTKLNKLRCEAVKAAGGELMLATVTRDNYAQHRIMHKNGWVIVQTLQNVVLYRKIL